MAEPRKPLIIAGQRIGAGVKRDLYLKFGETYTGISESVPIHVINSRRPGPVVCVSGAIHGDELAGVGIIRELLFDRLPTLTRGALVCVPIANLYGLENHSRYLPDRRDLNRTFPGSRTGSLSSRLAYALFHEVVMQCDYAIDFHSAAVRRTNYPNVRANMNDPKVAALAHAFGCELIVDGTGPEGSLRSEAVKRGIPTIILEAGEVWKIEPGVVEIGVRGCLNVLKTLEMIKGEPQAPLFEIAARKTTWVRAEEGGFLAFHKMPGDLVARGEVLATNYSIFGRERNLLLSPDYGIILGMSTMPAVKPGEPVFHIAVIAEKKFAGIKKKIRESGDGHLYNRMQASLATNFTLHTRGETA